MSKSLNLLYQDHANFRRVLNAMERRAALAQDNDHSSIEVLKQANAYWRGYPLNWHQATEDVIYGALICRFPRLATEIHDIIIGHRTILDRLCAIGAELINVEVNFYEWRAALGRSVLSFVQAERAHIQREESILFPAAEQWLSSEDWDMIDRLLPVDQDALSCSISPNPFDLLQREIQAIEPK
jgi:hemerythrin-like domain-containing protein